MINTILTLVFGAVLGAWTTLTVLIMTEGRTLGPQKINCEKCKNYASLYCRDCIHRPWLMDFYREDENEVE